MRRLIRVGGALLALAAGAFFIRHARNALAGQDLSSLWTLSALSALVALTLLYMLTVPSTSVAWTWLLRALRQQVGCSRLLAILAVVQIGKYLPGNVAHHLGRIALARAEGVSLVAAVYSVACEALLLLLAATHVSAMTLVGAQPAMLAELPLMRHRWPLLTGVTMLAIVALAMAPYLATWLVRLRRQGMATDGSERAPSLALGVPVVAGCYAMYLLNFVLIGLGLWLMAQALVPAGSAVPGVWYLVGAFASSWFLGFVIPGAPAGLGVREAVLSGWLVGTMPDAQVVVLIVALRVATTVGDLLVFAAGGVGMRRTRVVGRPPREGANHVQDKELE